MKESVMRAGGLIAGLLSLLTAAFGLVSCQKVDIDEKLGPLEGEYVYHYVANPGAVDANPYPAYIRKESGQWYFIYNIPTNSEGGMRSFRQRMTWNPVVANYIFESLPESDCAFFNATPDRIVTHYKPDKITMMVLPPENASLPQPRFYHWSPRVKH